MNRIEHVCRIEVVANLNLGRSWGHLFSNTSSPSTTAAGGGGSRGMMSNTSFQSLTFLVCSDS
jgi:hypothetical protein